VIVCYAIHIPVVRTVSSLVHQSHMAHQHHSLSLLSACPLLLAVVDDCVAAVCICHIEIMKLERRSTVYSRLHTDHRRYSEQSD
jgi:hypothetical protein